MKWLYLIVTNILKQLMESRGGEILNPADEIKKLFKQNLVKILLLFATITGVVGFFVAGFVMTMVNLAIQYDLKENYHITGVIISGIALMVIGVLVITSAILFVTKDIGHKKKHETEMKKQMASNPIQDAMVLLINDYVAERELEREFKRMSHNRHQYHGHKDPSSMSDHPVEGFERH